ncbi:MAG: NHLP leader peptide family RiPP precursor [Lachnospiraceae bacterium]|nr:NHLP leader peptide family RiPP precursor [Lachnospiraceae bacterium]
MERWTQEEMDSIYKNLMQKAVTDEAFRKELVADPNAAISKATGKSIPADYRIRIIEDDPSYQSTFLLPPFAGEDLSEDDLKSIAGGICHGDSCPVFKCGKNTPK